MRIGLDIDDCLADFWGAYCDYFDVVHKPKNLQDNIITKNVENILKYDRNFWLNLKVINKPNFIPELYCTKRVNCKSWTKKWLEINDFPIRPIYQMYYQHGNKANMIKGKVDIFIDDSYSNVVKCIQSGIPALMIDGKQNINNPMFKIYSLDIEEILDTYFFLKLWK